MGSAPGLQSRAAEHPVTAGTAPKAERRHLRVLFCDLVPIPHVSGSRPNVPGIKRGYDAAPVETTVGDADCCISGPGSLGLGGQGFSGPARSGSASR